MVITVYIADDLAAMPTKRFWMWAVFSDVDHALIIFIDRFKMTSFFLYSGYCLSKYVLPIFHQQVWKVKPLEATHKLPFHLT